MNKRKTSIMMDEAARHNLDFIQSRVGCNQTAAIEAALAHFAGYLAQIPEAETDQQAAEQGAAPDRLQSARSSLPFGGG